MMTTGMCAPAASSTGRDEGLVVERGEHDAAHLAADEVLDDLRSAASRSSSRSGPFQMR